MNGVYKKFLKILSKLRKLAKTGKCSKIHATTTTGGLQQKQSAEAHS